jgi:hypothetical protein
MRAIICSIILLASFTAPAPAQPPAANTATQHEAAQLRATADKLLADGNPDDAAKAAALLEKAAALDQQQSNADKLAMERLKLKHELEASDQSHWLSALVTFIPLATTIILAGTLIFQISQARSERQDRQKEREDEARDKQLEREFNAKDKEDQRFMDALNDIQTSEHISTAATLINTFQDEPYKTRILNMAVTLLLSRTSMEEFERLFMEVMNPLTYDKMPQMQSLCHQVDANYFAVAAPNWDSNLGRVDVAKLSPEQLNIYNLVSRQQVFLSSKIGALLRTPAPGGMQVDLSRMVIRNLDLSGVDLGSPNVSATNWTYINLDGADLSGITQFDNSVMSATAWWHAARISHPFLEFLVKNVPFNPSDDYKTPLPVSQEDFDTSVAKLRAGGSEVGGSRARSTGTPAPTL